MILSVNVRRTERCKRKKLCCIMSL